MLVDSHCHLTYPGLKEDIKGVLERAKKQDVHQVMCISTTLEEGPEVIRVAETFKHVKATVGLHPGNVTTQNVPSFEALKSLASHDEVVGLGETGLDFYYDAATKAPQIESLNVHMAVSKTMDLPLVIHAREAESELIDALATMKDSKNPGVIHCFGGSEAFGRKMLDYGFYISISGIITFKNAESLRDTVKKFPLDRLLVETDAPYLAPVPKRGKTNEPSFVRYTAEALATLFELPVAKIQDVTTKNYFDVFKKAAIRR